MASIRPRTRYSCNSKLGWVKRQSPSILADALEDEGIEVGKNLETDIVHIKTGLVNRLLYASYEYESTHVLGMYYLKKAYRYIYNKTVLDQTTSKVVRCSAIQINRLDDLYYQSIHISRKKLSRLVFSICPYESLQCARDASDITLICIICTEVGRNIDPHNIDASIEFIKIRFGTKFFELLLRTIESTDRRPGDMKALASLLI